MISVVVLTGCGLAGRPPSVACAAPAPENALSFMAASLVGQSMTPDVAMQSVVEAIVEQATEDRRGAVDIDVLSLSAGGQYGSFGAGFMKGWSQQPAGAADARPDFELVTGISAGALFAPIAFAGSDFDHLLDPSDGLSSSDIFNVNPFAWLTGASFSQTVPLERRIRASLDSELIGAIAARYTEDEARLLIGATNLDTTETRYFDLARIAATLPEPEARDCMTEVMLASAAIPAVFPPRHIDGDLYADGGLRDHVFLRDVETARVMATRQLGRSVNVNAYIIVNGALQPPDGRINPNDPRPELPHTLLDTTLRGVVILSDEVLRDSISEAITFAHSQSRWDIKGIVAEPDFDALTCVPTDSLGGVDPCLTSTLFAHGLAVGSQTPIPWLPADALLARANDF